MSPFFRLLALSVFSYHSSSCGVKTLHPTSFLSTWLFYLVRMLYDLLTLSISMAYLFKYHSSSPLYVATVL